MFVVVKMLAQTAYDARIVFNERSVNIDERYLRSLRQALILVLYIQSLSAYQWKIPYILQRNHLGFQNNPSTIANINSFRQPQGLHLAIGREFKLMPFDFVFGDESSRVGMRVINEMDRELESAVERETKNVRFRDLFVEETAQMPRGLLNGKPLLQSE
ncbi:hypothetical protein WI83_25720 [Burkholderia ubonensis]|nr:hypothetical protein WI83_25720 [Burkholderia ubonensis]